jgi:hypothetical protein
VKWLIAMLLVSLTGCSQESDVDKCVDAQMKVYDEQYPKSSKEDRDQWRAGEYRACMQQPQR